MWSALSAQVLIVCSTGLAGIMLLNYQQDYTVWVLPLIIVCLFAFLVAHCFLSIYEMVVDVLFLCFAIDTKYNDGSPGREFYMDKVLMVSSSDALRCWRGQHANEIQPVTLANEVSLGGTGKEALLAWVRPFQTHPARATPADRPEFTLCHSAAPSLRAHDSNGLFKPDF